MSQTLQLHHSLPAVITRIWSPTWKPTVQIKVGTSNDPYSAKPTEWVTKAMTRQQAARVLREARSEGLLIEADRAGYVISGGMEFPQWSQR